MRIALDVMGGDFGPQPAVAGAVEALASDPHIHVTLVGDQDQIEPMLANLGENAARVAFEHTTEVVGMDESPAQAIKKRDSSIFRCWQLLADGTVEGIVSAGNTGAVWAAGLKMRRFLRYIRRPAIAVTMPTAKGLSVLLDVGANTHPKPSHLFQYGIMGSIFARTLLKKERPTIGLLNVGSEESKGNILAKETAALFLNSPIRERFHGNIEGRDIWHGVVDVVVCDGFVGNIVLKTCEGILEFLTKAVGQELLGALTVERDRAKAALMQLYGRYHHSEFGGAPLLGIDGVCLICHGASDAKAIRNAIKRAKSFNEVNRLIVREMETSLAEMQISSDM